MPYVAVIKLLLVCVCVTLFRFLSFKWNTSDNRCVILYIALPYPLIVYLILIHLWQFNYVRYSNGDSQSSLRYRQEVALHRWFYCLSYLTHELSFLSRLLAASNYSFQLLTHRLFSSSFHSSLMLYFSPILIILFIFITSLLNATQVRGIEFDSRVGRRAGGEKRFLRCVWRAGCAGTSGGALLLITVFVYWL